MEESEMILFDVVENLMRKAGVKPHEVSPLTAHSYSLDTCTSFPRQQMVKHQLQVLPMTVSTLHTGLLTKLRPHA